MDTRLLDELLDRPIAYHRIFAQFTGCVATGVFLSQAFYWSRRTSDPDGWFYKSGAEWTEETVLTRRQQEKARNSLKTKGILDEKLEGVPARLYFRIDKAKLINKIDAFLAQKSVQTEQSKEPVQFVQNVQTRMYKTCKQACTKRTNYHAEITIQRLHAETTEDPDFLEDSKIRDAASAWGGDNLDKSGLGNPGESIEINRPSGNQESDNQPRYLAATDFPSELPAIEFSSPPSTPTPLRPSIAKPAPKSAQVRRCRQSTPKAKARDPRGDHPAIQAVRSLLGKYPSKLLWDKLIELIGDTPNLQRLTAARQDQLIQGINPQSLVFVEMASGHPLGSESIARRSYATTGTRPNGIARGRGEAHTGQDFQSLAERIRAKDQL